MVEHLKREQAWRLFVAPDHYTPIVKRTHIAEPVPFIFAGSDLPFCLPEQPKLLCGTAPPCCSERPYTEADAKATGIVLDRGYELMLRLIKGWQHYV